MASSIASIAETFDMFEAGWIFRTKCDFLKPIGGFNFPAARHGY